MSKSSWARIAVVLLLIALIYRTCYTVDETQAVVITRFGRPVAEIREPGLYVKTPWDRIWRLDNRVQVYDPGPSPFLTQDKKMLQIDNYVCWRIADPQRYIQTVADATMAKRRIHDCVWSEVSAQLGKLELSNVISTTPGGVQLDSMLEGVTANCAETARRNFGIEIADVGMKRLVFPEQNLESVFSRMRAERQRIAKKYRAEGQQEAEKIKAEADKERDRIVSEAYMTAEKTKGEGEAEATRIYSAAHSADPAFYKMVRTLQAYEKMFDKDTTIVLSADSELLKLMTQGRAGSR